MIVLFNIYSLNIINKKIKLQIIMKSIEGLKMAIISELKERGKGVGETIPMSEWDTILDNYSAQEQDLFMQAIRELKKEGKIECELGGLNSGISLK